MASVAPTEHELRKTLGPYKRPSTQAAMSQLVNTALPFGLLLCSMAWSLSASYFLTLTLAIPTGFLLVRLFVLQHDCGHMSFFPSRAANRWVGSVLGVVTMFPYGYWRRTHALHHATSGNLEEREMGDVKTLTVREYQRLSPLRRLLYRLYRNPLVLLGLGPIYQFGLKHRFPFGIPWSWKREWLSVLWTNVGLAATYAALSAWLGWQAVLLVHLPVFLVSGAVGVYLFYIQHQFEDTYWQPKETWDFHRAGSHGSSFLDLPRPLHWLTGNIGFHHIHHLASRIPNYRLQQCFRELPWTQNVTRLNLRQSLQCFRLKLWDEDRGALVGWEAVGGDREPLGSPEGPQRSVPVPLRTNYRRIEE